MKEIRDILKNRILILDGAMGTMIKSISLMKMLTEEKNLLITILA